MLSLLSFHIMEYSNTCSRVKPQILFTGICHSHMEVAPVWSNKSVHHQESARLLMPRKQFCNCHRVLLFLGLALQPVAWIVATEPAGTLTAPLPATLMSPLMDVRCQGSPTSSSKYPTYGISSPFAAVKESHPVVESSTVSFG